MKSKSLLIEGSKAKRIVERIRKPLQQLGGGKNAVQAIDNEIIRRD